MEFKKDLLKEVKNSKLRLFFSIAFYIVAIGYILAKIYNDKALMWFDWIYSFAMFLSGFSHMMSYFGYPVERLIGKAYVKIDSNLILFKPSLYDTEQKIDWNYISAIDSKKGYLNIVKNDNSTIKLMLSKLSYSDNQEIKEVVGNIAKNKNISLTID